MLKRCVFNRINIGMIPLSYLESLSYEEQILWLQKNLNDVIELVNKLQEELDNIDINFDEIQREINLINEELVTVNTNIQNLDNTKADKTEVQSQLTALELQLRTLITENYNTLKEYVDENDAYLQYQIDHFDIGNITLLDPTTGLQSSIQTVVDNIYDVSRSDGISAGEFDSLELTASEFDAKEITAFNFDQHSLSLLTE